MKFYFQVFQDVPSQQEGVVLNFNLLCEYFLTQTHDEENTHRILFSFWKGLASALQRRSIDLIQAHGLISDSRLPLDITPVSYDLELLATPENEKFVGKVKIVATWLEETDKIQLHADEKFEIIEAKVTHIGNDNKKWV